jgi:nucleoside-diphosphate-sugar epimerase
LADVRWGVPTSCVADGAGRPARGPAARPSAPLGNATQPSCAAPASPATPAISTPRRDTARPSGDRAVTTVFLDQRSVMRSSPVPIGLWHGEDSGCAGSVAAPRQYARDMARVAVTGSSGKLGRAVVDDLVAHGWEVVALDRAPSHRPDVASTVVDLTDFGQAGEALSAVDDRHQGVDALVHLAAIPAPGLRTNAATFANNATASYNVYSAALRAGIRKIVWASSETVLGLPFDEPPPYVPVDEEYPPRPNSTYSLVKTLEEEMARQLCRWHPDLSMTGLRFSNVMYPEDYAAFPSFDADARLRSWNLWGYIDARDGAQAVRRALAYDAPGADVFIIANADTVMSRPNEELLAEVFPDVPRQRPVGPNETLLSIDKARRVLGYEPEHSWRDSSGPA